MLWEPRNISAIKSEITPLIKHSQFKDIWKLKKVLLNEHRKSPLELNYPIFMAICIIRPFRTDKFGRKKYRLLSGINR